jgi:hypothetical protein
MWSVDQERSRSALLVLPVESDVITAAKRGA